MIKLKTNLPTPPPSPPKVFFKSKTLVVNFLIAISPLIPGIGTWTQAHPVLALQFIVYANMALRLITKGSVYLYSSDE
jgi:hypothetical protein